MHARAAVVSILTSGFLAFGSAQGAVLSVAELSSDRIAALDRRTTVVILPGGILEEHGPHLPSYTDGYQNEWLSAALADAVAGRPGWTALVFPTIPLGAGGANEIGGQFVWPGTYAVRPSTLRAVFMDLATELGEQGFRWVFVVHGHGSPAHNRALDQAADYFRDTFGQRMVHLDGLEACDIPESTRTAGLSPEVAAEDASSLHAGLSETGRLLYLRPDLVSPDLEKLPPVTASGEGRLRAASAPGWPGYFGAPRHATAARGEAEMKVLAAACIELAMRVLDGADERAFPRYADRRMALPSIRKIMEASTRNSIAVGERQRAWLRAHPTPDLEIAP